MLNPDAPGGTGRTPTPKKKKKKKVSFTPYAPNAVTPVRNVQPSRPTPSPAPSPVAQSSYTKPPSYGRVKPPLRPPSVVDYFSKPSPDKPSGLADLLSGRTALPSKPTDTHDLTALLSGQGVHDSVADPKADTHSALQDWLQAVADRTNKAPEGYTPGAEKLQEGEYAYVPNRLKMVNGRLKDYWDRDFINSSRDDFKYPSQYQQFLNGIMEQQFQDREKWLLGKRYRQSARIQDVLTKAGDEAYKGNFDYLTKYMEKNPNFSMELPSYESEFGITPEQIADAWKKQKGQYTDPYERGAARYRMDLMRRHYDKMRTGYEKGGTYLDQVIDRYEKKYNKSVDFHDEKKAGPAIPKPGELSKDQRKLIDETGAANNPFKGNWQDPYFSTLTGKQHDETEAAAKKVALKTRREAMKTLGVKQLPTVKEMLGFAVASGDLDPKDPEAIDAAIEKYRNPNHPDTRAMYLGYAMQKNPDLDAKGAGLKYVNAPIEQYIKDETAAAEAQKKAEDEYDAEHTSGVFDFIGDAWDRTAGRGTPLLDVRAGGGGQGVVGDKASDAGGVGVSQLGWTFDKLARLNYAVAGMADAWYNLDKDKTHSWVESNLTKFDPMSIMTGANTFSSIDDVLEDPSGLGAVAKAGYQQAFRGSNLPGTPDDIVPIMFSHVIANNAMRDREDNIYDKSWYQHIMGFGLDVAYDPINLIGVGIVDDTLKIPVRVAKELATAGREDKAFVETMDVLNKIEAPNMGPVPEKVFRINQGIRRIGDDVGGQPLVDDATIEATQLGTMNVHYINHQLSDLAIQEKQLRNDLGTQALHEELDGVASGMPLIKPELRVSKLAAENAIPIHGSSFENPGGRFWRDWLDPLENAARDAGHYNVRYADTVAGQAAKKASEELTRLENAIDDGFMEETPAVLKRKAELEDQVYNKAYERDPETGVVPVTHEADVQKFIDEGMPGFKPTFDPVAAFARSVGMTRAEFLAQHSERDIYDALTLGPRMYTESDPAAAAEFVQAQNRIDAAQRTIDTPGVSKEKLEKAYLAKQIGYQMQSQVTLGGALHYLDSLSELRWANSERHMVRGGLQDRLDQINAAIDDVYDTTGYESIVDSVGGNYIGGFEGARGAGGEDISLPQQGTRTQQRLSELNAEKQQIMDELEQVALDEGRPTKLPPAAAYAFKPEPGSAFLKSDGSVDYEGFANAFYIKGAEDGEETLHHIAYNAPEGATPHDYELLDKVKGSLENQYHAEYRRLKTEAVKAHQTEVAPVSSAEAALGPRPTMESMRLKYPNYFKREMKGNTPEVRESTVPDGKGGWLHTDEDVVIRNVGGVRGSSGLHTEIKGARNEKGQLENIDDATTAQVRSGNRGVEGQLRATAEQNLARTGGKRTARQKRLERLVKTEQRRWDVKAARAREIDKARRGEIGRDFQLSSREQGVVQQTAFKNATDNVIGSLKEGKIKRVPGNMRLTVRETAAAMRKRVTQEAKVQDLLLQIEQMEAKSAEELSHIKMRREALEIERKEQIKAIDEAVKVAQETQKAGRRVVGEEHVLQLNAMPPRATGKMVQLRLMGMRKNLQFTNNLFRGAEKFSQLVPAKFRENFANYMYRPSKLLDSREAILFRAQWESKTPVIIKANVETLNRLMRDVHETERVAMMKAYRDGIDYEGPKMDLYPGIKKELDDIVSIWNRKNDFYRFQDLGAVNPTHLSWGEIQKFLPAEYQPNLKVLSSLAKKNKGQVTGDIMIQAIKANGGKVQDLLDPFRFAWVMRLAADQSRQYRALTHSMANTFGVKTGIRGSHRAKILKTLETKYGWVEHKELPGYLFPPESANDVKQLLKIAEPGKAHHEITKLFDQVQGYWKQSMTIYNPGYYTRNGVGEVLASWLDGVNHPKWYRMAYRIHRYTKKEDFDLAALVKKWSVLEDKVPVDVAHAGEYLFTLKGGTKVTIEDALRQYVNQGLKSTFANTDLDRGVRGLANAGLAKGPIKRAASKINEGVHEAGEGFEDYLRMAHFLHAMQHSGHGSLFQAAKYAAERVRKYHFDYTDFSTFEKTVMLRAFPFYKWTRRGAPLMLAHLFMTPGKMVALPKAMNMMSGLGVDPMGAITDDPVLSISDVHDDKNGVLPNYSGIAPGWVRDLFAYQMQPAPDDEYGNYFRIQTPQIDGLNAVLGLTPGAGNNSIGEILGDSQFNTLLSPFIKMPAELISNRSLDPDFPYDIRGGGKYNEANGINPLEAVASYVARGINPDLGFLAKLSKNGQMPFGIGNMGDGSYRDEHGYDASRDVASFVTGAGFYQAMQEKPKETEPSNSAAVGGYDLSQIPLFSDRKVADNPPGYDGSGGQPTLNDILGYMASGSSGSSGNGGGWVNYPHRNFYNFHNFGGYGNSGYGNSGYGSSGSLNNDFWELITRLRKAMEQGEVID